MIILYHGSVTVSSDSCEHTPMLTSSLLVYKSSITWYTRSRVPWDNEPWSSDSPCRAPKLAFPNPSRKHGNSPWSNANRGTQSVTKGRRTSSQTVIGLENPIKDSFVFPLNGISLEPSAVNTTLKTELSYRKTPNRRTNEKAVANIGTMSKIPAPKFDVGETVINWEEKLKGTVKAVEWVPVYHDYLYQYQCEYSTQKIKG